MSAANVALIERAFAAWEGSVDLEAALALFHDDVVVRRLAPLPDPRTGQGREVVLEVVIEWIEDFDDFEMWAEEYVDAGDEVVVETVQRARGTTSGAPVEGRYWFVWEVRDGLIARMDIHSNRADAFAAAGLTE